MHPNQKVTDAKYPRDENGPKLSDISINTQHLQNISSKSNFQFYLEICAQLEAIKSMDIDKQYIGKLIQHFQDFMLSNVSQVSSKSMETLLNKCIDSNKQNGNTVETVSIDGQLNRLPMNVIEKTSNFLSLRDVLSLGSSSKCYFQTFCTKNFLKIGVKPAEILLQQRSLEAVDDITDGNDYYQHYNQVLITAQPESRDQMQYISKKVMKCNHLTIGPKSTVVLIELIKDLCTKPNNVETISIEFEHESKVPLRECRKKWKYLSLDHSKKKSLNELIINHKERTMPFGFLAELMYFFDTKKLVLNGKGDFELKCESDVDRMFCFGIGEITMNPFIVNINETLKRHQYHSTIETLNLVCKGNETDDDLNNFYFCNELKLWSEIEYFRIHVKKWQPQFIVNLFQNLSFPKIREVSVCYDGENGLKVKPIVQKFLSVDFYNYCLPASVSLKMVVAGEEYPLGM